MESIIVHLSSYQILKSSCFWSQSYWGCCSKRRSQDICEHTHTHTHLTLSFAKLSAWTMGWLWGLVRYCRGVSDRGCESDPSSRLTASLDTFSQITTGRVWGAKVMWSCFLKREWIRWTRALGKKEVQIEIHTDIYRYIHKIWLHRQKTQEGKVRYVQGSL